MIYRQGIRCNIPRLRVVRVSSYIAAMHGGETEIVKYRYAFEQETTGYKFVYTGRLMPLLEGRTYDIRGTVKQEINKYGFIRLSRIRKVQLDPELDL